MKDYYYILGVNIDASLKEIKQSYKKLGLKFHPDKNNGDPYFEERFKDIQEAYDTLSSETRRTAYDFRHKSFYDERSRSSKNSRNVPNPSILEFSCNKNIVRSGDIIELSWRTKYAEKVIISCLDGNQPSSGTTGVIVKTVNNNTQFHISLKAIGFDNVETIATLTVSLSLEDNSYKQAETDKSTSTESTISEEKSDRNSSSVARKSMVALLSLLLVAAFIKGRIVEPKQKEDLTTSANQAASYENSHANRDRQLSSSQTLVAFINALNQQDYDLAYSLTNNKLWHSREMFENVAWGNLSHFNIKDNPREKFYESKWDADEIWSLTFTAYDSKSGDRKNLEFDFHLSKLGTQWMIVRMIYPRKEVADSASNTNPQEGIPLDIVANLTAMKHKSELLFLQDYYSNFKSKISVFKNKNFYAKTLTKHFGELQISQDGAVRKDREDFVLNDIESYIIYVDATESNVEYLANYNLVHALLHYAVKTNNGSESFFRVNVDIAINKESTKILAIDRVLSSQDRHDLNNAYPRYKIIKTNPTHAAIVYNPTKVPYTGKRVYDYCYNYDRPCKSSCSEVKVTASADRDVIVLLKKSNVVVADVFIQKGDASTILIPNGTYQPYFMSGTTWSAKKFITETKCGDLYGGFSNNFTIGKDAPVTLNNQRMSYTLRPMKNGNFSVKGSNIEEAF